jgi:copper chaperone CopZ
MKTIRLTAAVAMVLMLTAAANAGQVTVKGVHLCCGQCVNDVNDILGDVAGVSNVASDRDSKTVSFTAADEKAAKAGVDALAKGGFHGAAAHGDKEIAFPDSGAKKGAKADTVTISGVHLCCGACVNAVKKILEGVDGASTIDIDRNAKTVKLTGSGIDVSNAVATLNKGGFHGTVK